MSSNQTPKYYSDRNLTMRFVSNIDGNEFVEATRDLDAAETLFIVSSKTFTTLETLTNAHSAREWCVQALGSEQAVEKHFVAVSRKARDGSEARTDQGNMILDSHFGPIADPQVLAEKLAMRAGIVELGLFLNLTRDVIVAGSGGCDT